MERCSSPWMCSRSAGCYDLDGHRSDCSAHGVLSTDGLKVRNDIQIQSAKCIQSGETFQAQGGCWSRKLWLNADRRFTQTLRETGENVDNPFAECKRHCKSINLLEGANWVWQVENEVHFLAACKLKWLLLQNSMNIKITSDSSVTESRKLLHNEHKRSINASLSHCPSWDSMNPIVWTALSVWKQNRIESGVPHTYVCMYIINACFIAKDLYKGRNGQEPRRAWDQRRDQM